MTTNNLPALLGGPPLIPQGLQWNSTIGTEELNAVKRVLDSGKLSDFYGSPGDRFLGGVEVKNFENAFKVKFNAKYAISVNSATSGLFCAVAALNLQAGDEVIVPPWTMSATAMSIVAANATPIFADIENDFFTISPADIEMKITPKTKAIIAVNLFGQACDFEAILAICKKHKLFLIEDNAQGPGGTYKGQSLGTIGDIGIFSLNCHKAMQCGEGGVILTNDQNLAYKMQLLRNHGENIVSHNNSEDLKNIVGYNFRLTEIQAAIAHEQLLKLDQINQYKRKQVKTLDTILSKYNFIKIPKRRSDSLHSFYLDPYLYLPEVLEIPRERFINFLKAEGFKAVGGYVNPLYKLPYFANKPQGKITLPIVEELHQRQFFYFDIVRHIVDDSVLTKLDLALSNFEKYQNELKKI